jgi:GH43 family beta-xylosidase
MSEVKDDLSRLLELKTGVSKPIEKRSSPLPVILEEEELPAEDNPVYGFDRTRKPKMMLSFRRANKTTRHIPYHHIYMVDETGGRFITVYTAACSVTIEGENLEAISRHIKRGDLSYIQEGTATAPDGAKVDAIKFEAPGE